MEMADLNTTFAHNGAQFAVDLLQIFSLDSSEQNLVFSPFSIQISLAFLFADSSGNTAKELVKGLRLVSNVPEDEAQVFHTTMEHLNQSKLFKIGNKVYVSETFKLSSDYQKVVETEYLSEVESINFSESELAANKINQWISQISAGKITNLIFSDGLESAAAVLLNVIHFKGEWESKFDEKSTHLSRFWVERNRFHGMQFMSKEGKFFNTFNADLDCRILEMPYENSDLSMLVLLPTEINGLKDLVSKLRGINFLDLTKNLVETIIHVRFPKFKIEFSVDLNETLHQLGISKIFGNEAELNTLLEICSDLKVSKFLHKAVIEVNEEGTEAAPGTSVLAYPHSSVEVFNANHPFLYLIWNRKNILFVGVLMEPGN